MEPPEKKITKKQYARLVSIKRLVDKRQAEIDVLVDKAEQILPDSGEWVFDYLHNTYPETLDLLLIALDVRVK
jgi:hypothetical protein